MKSDTHTLIFFLSENSVVNSTLFFKKKKKKLLTGLNDYWSSLRPVLVNKISGFNLQKQLADAYDVKYLIKGNQDDRIFLASLCKLKKKYYF